MSIKKETMMLPLLLVAKAKELIQPGALLQLFLKDPNAVFPGLFEDGSAGKLIENTDEEPFLCLSPGPTNRHVPSQVVAISLDGKVMQYNCATHLGFPCKTQIQLDFEQLASDARRQAMKARTESLLGNTYES